MFCTHDIIELFYSFLLFPSSLAPPSIYPNYWFIE